MVVVPQDKASIYIVCTCPMGIHDLEEASIERLRCAEVGDDITEAVGTLPDSLWDCLVNPEDALLCIERRGTLEMRKNIRILRNYKKAAKEDHIRIVVSG